MRILFLILPIWAFSSSDDFALHMGRDTPAWQHCKTGEDHRRYSFFEELFQKNQNVSPSPTPKIPHKLHFIWLGSAPIPKEVQGRISKWIDLHPGWEGILWSDVERTIVGLRWAEPPEDLARAYYEAVDIETKAALLSFEILEREGGLYIHPQTTPFRPFTLPCAQYSFFCGLKPLGSTSYSSSIMPSNHLIGAQAGHPILAETKKDLERGPAVAFALGVDRGVGEDDIVFPATYMSEQKRKAGSFAVYLPSLHQDFSPFEQKIERTLTQILAKEKQEIVFLLWIVGISFCSLLVLALYARRALPLLLLFACGLHGSDTFYQEMGSETSHWEFVSDVGVLEKFARRFERSRDQEHVSTSYRIPKIIHFIWLGPHPFPDGSVENVRDFLAHHPDWTVKFWTDRARPAPCNDMQVCDVQDFSFAVLKECYESSENWGEKSDILRFEILAQEGGLYVDHDASCLQPFDGLHKGYEFYCGLEVPHPPVAGRTITAGNGVIGARPQHPVIEKVIESIATCWEPVGKKYRGADGYSRTQLVMERTYIRLTEALDELTDADIVLPASYFFAKKGLKPVFSRHQFANAWAQMPSENKSFQKQAITICKKLKKRKGLIRIGAGVALCLNLIVQAGIFLRLRKNKQRRT